MPLPGLSRPFPAVTTLVVVLVGLFAITALIRPLIPPAPPNELDAFPGDYLAAAARQEVPWMPIGPEAFQIAKVRDTPILLAIGDVWSRPCRIADERGFADQDNVDLLRRRFVCIRIDTSEHPEWARVFLPIRRARSGADDSLQIYFLDPEGQLLGSIIRSRPLEMVLATPLNRVLRRVLAEFAKSRRNPMSRIEAAEEQRAEYTALTEADPNSSPDHRGHSDWLRSKMNPKHGGFFLSGFQPLRPLDLQFILDADGPEVVKSGLQGLLRSSVVDWIFGGFFRLAENEDYSRIEFDQLAVLNAYTMRFFAVLADRSNDRLARVLAERAFDALSSSWVAPYGGIWRYRVSDETDASRSDSCSFSPRLLRDNFNSEERDYLSEELGLQPGQNPQMAIRVRNPNKQISSEHFWNMIERLQALANRRAPVFGGGPTLDVTGSVVALMIDTAKALEDQTRLATAIQIARGIDEFRSGFDDVVRSKSTSRPASHTLSDYLAYSDAALKLYSSTGDADWLAKGARVLRRALFLYEDSRSGVYPLARLAEQAPGVQYVELPDLFDGWGESSVARVIRLCAQYSVQLGEKGSDLLDAASATAARYAAIANTVRNQLSGYFLATMILEDVVAERSGDGL